MTDDARSPRLPLPDASDERALVVVLALAAMLGEGLEPALRGFGSDAMVRGVGLLAGWFSALASILVLVAIGYFVVRSVLVGRANMARSLLTGATAASIAFACMGLAAGHVGPTSTVQLVALVSAFLAARSLGARTMEAALVPACAALFGVAAIVSSRAFESGGVVEWGLARSCATGAWAIAALLTVRLSFHVRAHTTPAARHLQTLLTVVLVAIALASRRGLGEATTLSRVLGGVLSGAPVAIPPFGPWWLPRVIAAMARLEVLFALVLAPRAPLGARWVVAFVPSLPAPLAVLALVLAAQVHAAGSDDDDARAA